MSNYHHRGWRRRGKGKGTGRKGRGGKGSGRAMQRKDEHSPLLFAAELQPRAPAACRISRRIGPALALGTFESGPLVGRHDSKGRRQAACGRRLFYTVGTLLLLLAVASCQRQQYSAYGRAVSVAVATADLHRLEGGGKRASGDRDRRNKKEALVGARLPGTNKRRAASLRVSVGSSWTQWRAA